MLFSIQKNLSHSSVAALSESAHIRTLHCGWTRCFAQKHRPNLRGCLGRKSDRCKPTQLMGCVGLVLNTPRSTKASDSQVGSVFFITFFLWLEQWGSGAQWSTRAPTRFTYIGSCKTCDVQCQLPVWIEQNERARLLHPNNARKVLIAHQLSVIQPRPTCVKLGNAIDICSLWPHEATNINHGRPNLTQLKPFSRVKLATGRLTKAARLSQNHHMNGSLYCQGEPRK